MVTVRTKSSHAGRESQELAVPWINRRTLRTSHALWLKLAGADPKDAQGQTRHSRSATTMDIYTQY